MDDEPENEVKSRESGDKVTAERVQHAEHHVWFSHTRHLSFVLLWWDSHVCHLLCFSSQHIFSPYFLFFYATVRPFSCPCRHISRVVGWVRWWQCWGEDREQKEAGVECVWVCFLFTFSEQLTRLPASWCVVRSAEGLTLLFQFFLKLNLHQIIKPLMKIYPEHINKENSVPSCHHFLQDAMG